MDWVHMLGLLLAVLITDNQAGQEHKIQEVFFNNAPIPASNNNVFLPVLDVSEDEEDMERLNYLTRLLAETKPPASCRPMSRTSREQAVRIMCSAVASTLARSGHSAPVAGSNGLNLPPDRRARLAARSGDPTGHPPRSGPSVPGAPLVDYLCTIQREDADKTS
ncbi:hypothetical protein DPEC_G00178150 [Dallia pectoralis]|uniref:Uncharacterized protein n=1 Tax=Dallia pectoralis TaxID=75939 RepID=A0ACC2GFL1_DALPE|nr:hypothetical protein DPEC_G00178150 [Dallia pectoralis]